MIGVELWRPIAGLEGKYEVSNYGSVRSIGRTIVTKKGYTTERRGSPIKIRMRKSAPSVVHIRIDGTIQVIRVCSLVADAFVPNPEHLSHVVHLNGDLRDDRATNLAWSAFPDYKGMSDWEGLSSSEHRLYGIWKCMVQRCENDSREYYYRYGGRGIRVCEEWHDFKAFVSWARSNGYENGLTIDRIDNDGNYCPENCRWVSAKAQSLNKSTNVFLEVGGKTLTALEWAEAIGMSQYTIYYWVRERGAEYAQRRISEKLGHCGARMEDA